MYAIIGFFYVNFEVVNTYIALSIFRHDDKSVLILIQLLNQ